MKRDTPGIEGLLKPKSREALNRSVGVGKKKITPGGDGV